MKAPKVAPHDHAHSARSAHHAGANAAHASRQRKSPARPPAHSAEQAAAAMHHVAGQLAGGVPMAPTTPTPKGRRKIRR